MVGSRWAAIVLDQLGSVLGGLRPLLRLPDGMRWPPPEDPWSIRVAVSYGEAAHTGGREDRLTLGGFSTPVTVLVCRPVCDGVSAHEVESPSVG
jgi:hypothetical protein